MSYSYLVNRQYVDRELIYRYIYIYMLISIIPTITIYKNKKI